MPPILLWASVMQFALTYAPGAYDTRSKLMGRQAAGLGFLRATLAAQPERLWCYAASRAHAEVFARDVASLTTHTPEVRFISWSQSERLNLAGTLYRPDPGLIDSSWRRQFHSGSRSYSICGITHTMSSHAAMSAVSGMITAPVFPWDALVCTSRVARDLIKHILETQIEELRSRLSATSFIIPQLPLIPLGVHTADFEFSLEQRSKARAELGLAEDDTAFLFAGRLSFHGKAHPMPMFIGLEGASGLTGKPISAILFGQFANAGVEQAFRKEAAQFAPSIRLVIIDGKDDQNRERAWAAADIFTSLSDNIQETFGLTPVEAMAAGLPVVVSDWDGYKDTVRDGIDGFRISTVMPGPGLGADLADRYESGVVDYDHYIGETSLYTAVNARAAKSAYASLVADLDLRRRMGAAGKKRAREAYDWAVVFRDYARLWEELAERRRADPKIAGEERRTRRPDRPDPFTLFRSFPTGSVQGSLKVRLTHGFDPSSIEGFFRLETVSYARSTLPPPDLCLQITGKLSQNDSQTIYDIVNSMKSIPSGQVMRAIAFLIKMSIMEYHD